MQGGPRMHGGRLAGGHDHVVQDDNEGQGDQDGSDHLTPDNNEGQGTRVVVIM